MTDTKPFDVTTRCQHCGGTRKEHARKAPFRCPTRLKQSYWRPWTVEAYEAAEQAGRQSVLNHGKEADTAGECLTCGTQCSDEGICPICAALERAEEGMREAENCETPTPAQKSEALRAINAAKDAEIESCRKCGQSLTLRDVVDGYACADQGEDEEEGNVFLYCSEHCRETH